MYTEKNSATLLILGFIAIAVWHMTGKKVFVYAGIGLAIASLLITINIPSCSAPTIINQTPPKV